MEAARGFKYSEYLKTVKVCHPIFFLQLFYGKSQSDSFCQKEMKMSDDSVEGINYLTNLYLRAFYSYHFLSEILQQDEYLQEYSRKFAFSSKIAQSNVQVMVDYLYSKGKRFVLMEPPRMLDFDLKKAAELDRTIRYCLKRLEQMALRDFDEDLLFTLKSKLVKKYATPIQIVKFTTEETKVKFKEESIKVVYKDKVDKEVSHPKEASSTNEDEVEDEDEASRDSKTPSPNSKENSGERSARGDHPSDFPLPMDEDEVKEEEAQQGKDDKEEEEGKKVGGSTLLDRPSDNGEWQDRQVDSGFLDASQDQ